MISYGELGSPTQEGQVNVAGLGLVWVAQRDLDVWGEHDYQGRYKLLSATSAAADVREFRLGALDPEL